jgi:hypothetical protein
MTAYFLPEQHALQQTQAQAAICKAVYYPDLDILESSLVTFKLACQITKANSDAKERNKIPPHVVRNGM